MNNIKLGNRLLAAASFVRTGSKVADIGTDHAYLAVYLARNNIARHVIAADVNILPLESAKKTILEYNISHKIDTVLSDGLSKITPDCDDIIICGMGGELIWEIIDKAKWLCDSKKRLILQPMTFAPFLRKQLYKNGFYIKNETAVCDNQKLYSVMCVEYCGVTAEVNEFFSLVGKLNVNIDETAQSYIKKQHEKVKKIYAGLLKSKDKKQDAEQYRILLSKFEELKKQ